MNDTKYEVLGVTVTCKDGFEYMPGLFGIPQCVGLCSGKGHPVSTENPNGKREMYDPR